MKITAEEFIREKIRTKNEIKGSMDALWKYLVTGEDALRWAHEFAQLQYNEAVDDVCQRVRLKTVSSSGNINTTSQEFHAYNTVVSVDVDTLKRLKKSVVSTD